MGSNVWFINDDLPEPETPVTHVKRPTGISAVILLRLFSLAFIIFIFCSDGFNLLVGMGIFLWPDKYSAVIEFLLFKILFKSPCAHISPPCLPAPGPISMMWSADLMASSSCSTTITVFPRFFRLFRVLINFVLSLWWSPIEGSSRTYVTPTRPEPIWLANLIRWASPPERVSALLSRVK